MVAGVEQYLARGKSSKRRLGATVGRPTIPEDELVDLWVDYLTNRKNIPARNGLLTAYFPLVDYLVNRIGESLPKCVHEDDLRDDGTFGLMDGLEKFNPDRGVKFETYGSFRIRGAILDGLRERDSVPRLVRHKYKESLRLSAELKRNLGREPMSFEVVSAMRENGISEQDYDRALKMCSCPVRIDFIEEEEYDSNDPNYSKSRELEDTREENPLEILARSEILNVAARELSEKARIMFTLYFLKGLTMKEIGKMLHLSESRVCQIYNQSLVSLREGENSKTLREFL